VNGLSNRKLERLRDKAYRDAYVRARINIGIPHQIRALREQRGWSQAELGRRAGKPSNVINRLENPESGGNTIRTCLEMASAFDVALVVKFVPYSRFLKEFEDVSPKALEVPDFTSDPGLIIGPQIIVNSYAGPTVSVAINQPEFNPGSVQYWHHVWSKDEAPQLSIQQAIQILGSNGLNVVSQEYPIRLHVQEVKSHAEKAAGV